jgi:hypothetical protein
LNGISLPDSGVNELASNGFVSFTIMPFASTPPGTRIENSATIYMDFQKPIPTNHTLNTLYSPDLVPGLVDSIQIITSVKQVHFSEKELSLFPNPTKGKMELNSPQEGILTLYSTKGEAILKTHIETGHNAFNLAHLPKGLYLAQLQFSGKQVSKKVILE